MKPIRASGIASIDVPEDLVTEMSILDHDGNNLPQASQNIQEILKRLVHT